MRTAVNGCGGREVGQTPRHRERDLSCVKSISTPLGVGTNYGLISGAEALLLALFHRATRPYSRMQNVFVCVCQSSNEKEGTKSLCLRKKDGNGDGFTE